MMGVLVCIGLCALFYFSFWSYAKYEDCLWDAETDAFKKAREERMREFGNKYEATESRTRWDGRNK